MENQALSIEDLAALIDEQSIVLTANSRQRRYLLKQFSTKADSKSDSFKGIDSSRILSFQQWLSEAWITVQGQAYPESAQLLINPIQSQLLWQEIINNSEESADLICPDLLAKQASSAWQLLSEWQTSAEELLNKGHRESEILYQWGLKFDHRCKELNLIDSPEQCRILSTALKSGALKHHHRLLMLGFDDLSPLRQDLSTAIADDVKFIQLKHLEQNQAYQLPCEDSHDEIYQCAKFVQNELLAAQSNKAALPKIAIVDPQLGQRRDKIERIFTEVLEPQFLYSETDRYTLPFNFSAGTPLGQCPIIESAIALLALNMEQLEVDKLCQLLQSPFWHNNAELEMELPLAERQQLEFALRNLQQEHIRTAQLRQCADKVAKKLEALYEPEKSTDNISLAERLQTLFYSQENRAKRNSAKQWSQIFYQQLEQLNWPGTRRLDSNEYQQVMQFQGLLTELLCLDQLDRLYSASEIIRELQQLANNHHFQAKTPDSPIQILGVLEASGQSFDICWLMGMDQKQWPPSPQANPLLPMDLQRNLNMPHASAERELFFAEQLIKAYRYCANKVVFSYPSREGEEELQASPLLEPLKLQQIVEITAAAQKLSKQAELPSSIQSYRLACGETGEFKWVDNRYGPKLSKREKSLGGSGVLKQQALCPFNAFAYYRLGAQAWPEVQLGISALERGNILHLALEAFWLEVKDQDHLLSLSNEKLEALVDRHIAESLDQILLYRRDLGPRYRALESERLKSIFMAYIELDKQRPNFSVDGIETSRELSLGPLKLNLRLDRIDKTHIADTDAENSANTKPTKASYVVIDYKTGQCDLKSWLGPRPDEPQLPLYSLSDPDISAISFAQLNAKGVKYIGISETASPADGIFSAKDQSLRKKLNSHDKRVANDTSISTDDEIWPQLRNQWQQDLVQLAIDYSSGLSGLDFKDTLAQRYSEDLLSLQRLQEFASKRRLWSIKPAPLQQSQFDLSL